MCFLLISMSQGILVVTNEIAVLAAGSHEHVAAMLAIVSIFGNIGGVIGLFSILYGRMCYQVDYGNTYPRITCLVSTRSLSDTEFMVRSSWHCQKPHVRAGIGASAVFRLTYPNRCSVILLFWGSVDGSAKRLALAARNSASRYFAPTE
jgi:hypothetical protein